MKWIVAVMYILQASSWSVCNYVIERKPVFYMEGLSFVTCVLSDFEVHVEFLLHQNVL